MNSRKKVNFARLGQTSAILTSLSLPTIISGTTTLATPVRPRVTKPPSPTTKPLTIGKLTVGNLTVGKLTLKPLPLKPPANPSPQQPKPISARVIVTHTASGTTISKSVQGLKMFATPSPEIAKPISARVIPIHPVSDDKTTSENVQIIKTTATLLTPSDARPKTQTTLRPSDPNDPRSIYTVDTDEGPKNLETTTLRNSLERLNYIDPDIISVLKEAQMFAHRELRFPINTSLTDPVAFREFIAKYSMEYNDTYFMATALRNHIRKTLDDKSKTPIPTSPKPTSIDSDPDSPRPILIDSADFDPFD